MKFDLSEAVIILEKTPRVLKELLEGIGDQWIKGNEGPETWSPYDVVGHLIHGEKTDWIPRTKIILSDGPKDFTPFDRFAHFEESKGKSMQDLLSEFSQLRKDNLDILTEFNLQYDDFDKTGTHPEFGSVSMKELLSAWVVHDLGHIHQITRVMAKQYKEAVGPWPKYMKVLNN